MGLVNNTMSERNSVAALQAAVLSCLTDILSCEQQKIKSAEAELKALEVTEGEKIEVGIRNMNA